MDEKEAIKTGSDLVANHGGVLAWCGAAVTMIGGWFTNRAKVQEIDKRLKDVEGRFVDVDGNERYVNVISYKEARIECRDGFEKQIDGLRDDVREDVNGLHGKIDEVLKILAGKK